MSGKTKLVLGLVGAAAVGVAIGLLLAPEKGADTRQKIKTTATDWSQHLSDLFASVKEGLSNLKDKGSKTASDLKDKGTKMASDATNRFSDVKESYS